MKRTETTHEDGNTYILHIVQFCMVLYLKKNRVLFSFLNVGRSIVVYLCPLPAGVFVRVTISQDKAIRFVFFSHGATAKKEQRREYYAFIYKGSSVLTLNIFQLSGTNRATVLGPGEKARSMAGDLCAVLRSFPVRAPSPGARHLPQVQCQKVAESSDL